MSTAATPPAPDDVEDDDPELLPCYRHPSRLTALHCIECERPICTDCAVAAAVGLKCPDDARIPRAARGAVPATRIVRGAVAAFVVAGFLGTLLDVLQLVVGSYFFGLILGYAVGAAVGVVARKASGGYRDPTLAIIAAVAAAAGMLALPVIDLLDGGHVTPFAVKLVAAGVAAYAARQRAVS
ncbi:MAG: hypothetical protein JWN41_607 [Thermoleophilia bacterium]|nr:hypothetical protein [Thermoleophilia bacterium]